MVKIAFAYAFSVATPSTTGGQEIEQNKYVDHVSTIVRLSTTKDGDLISYFDKIDAPQNGIKGLSLSHILIDHHVEAADRRKVIGQVPLKHIFGFCKTFKKITKKLGFHLYLKSTELQDLIYTTISVDINITIHK